MNTLKTYHYKLKPNKTQEAMLSQWLGTCRYLYNVALEYKILAYEQKGISLSKYDLINQLAEVKKVEGFDKIPLEFPLFKGDEWVTGSDRKIR